MDSSEKKGKTIRNPCRRLNEKKGFLLLLNFPDAVEFYNGIVKILVVVNCIMNSDEYVWCKPSVLRSFPDINFPVNRLHTK